LSPYRCRRSSSSFGRCSRMALPSKTRDDRRLDESVAFFDAIEVRGGLLGCSSSGVLPQIRSGLRLLWLARGIAAGYPLAPIVLVDGMYGRRTESDAMSRGGAVRDWRAGRLNFLHARRRGFDVGGLFRQFGPHCDNGTLRSVYSRPASSILGERTTRTGRTVADGHFGGNGCGRLLGLGSSSL
jgi:hypothetical protein